MGRRVKRLGRTPYFEIGDVRIYHGDSLVVAPELDYDVVITDPPYGISHPTAYRARKRDALARCNDYLPVHGDDQPFDPSPWLNVPCCLFGANYFSDRLPLSSGWLVWDKMRPDGLDQATCELAWTNFVKGVRRFRYRWNGCMRQGNEQLYHPTQKPIHLMRWILELKWTPPGVVLDPYMGAGATLLAADWIGREAIGIEYEERYCEIAANRLMEMNG